MKILPESESVKTKSQKFKNIVHAAALPSGVSLTKSSRLAPESMSFNNSGGGTSTNDDNLVDFDLQPGVLSAIAFVTLEAIAIGLIDYASGRVLSWYYYRLLAKGQKITLREANIPGVTRHQIGRRFAFHNLLATIIKVIALAIIFYINLSITSRVVREQSSPVYLSTYVLSPSNARWERRRRHSVTPEYDESRACYEANGDNLTFYPIVFNLSGGVQLENDYLAPESDGPYYEIDRSTLICAKPDNVMNPYPLAKVIGCAPRTKGGCKNSTVVKVFPDYNGSVPWTSSGGNRYSNNGRYFNDTTFDPDDIARWFPQYPKEKTMFQCVSYFVGAIQERQRQFHDCLLVYRPGSETWVQKWRLRIDLEKKKLVFLLNEPGPIFEGDIAFETLISVSTLQMIDADLFARDDYLKVASNLVALSGEFVGRTAVYLPIEKTVSSMPVLAIGFTFVIFTGAAFASILVIVALVHDSRPRFNTIFGLSTVMKHHFARAKGSKISDGRYRSHPTIEVSEDDDAVYVSLLEQDSPKATDKNGTNAS